MERAERSDEALMDAIGAQDVRAFEALYDRYARLVYSTAYGVLEDAQSAEDVVQEVFTRLWKAPQRYVPARGKFFSWLLSVTRNLAIDEYRARRRRMRNERQIVDHAASAFIADESSPGAFHVVEMRDQRALVREALATLPPEQRTAIALAYYKGMAQSEIAAALDTPLGTVKTRIRLGMQKLRTQLDEQVGTREGDAPLRGEAAASTAIDRGRVGEAEEPA
ncbi:MAG: sigma-70 family RNA polymerase sigma factor [Chloroflexi bacterium]|nr:sigma-70 family RNA polymerase sigma factor [Chloroflexota bacterium]